MQAYNKDYNNIMYYSNQNESPYSTTPKQDLQANNYQYNNVMYYNNLNASPITPNTSQSTNRSFLMPLSTPDYSNNYNYNYGYNSSPANSDYYHYKPCPSIEEPSQFNDVSTSFPSNCYYTPASLASTSLSSSTENYSSYSTCDLNSYYKKVSIIFEMNFLV